MRLGREACEAEVHHLDRLATRSGTKHHKVGGLQVAMNHAGFVCCFQSVAQIAE